MHAEHDTLLNNKEEFCPTKNNLPARIIGGPLIHATLLSPSRMKLQMLPISWYYEFNA